MLGEYEGAQPLCRTRMVNASVDLLRSRTRQATVGPSLRYSTLRSSAIAAAVPEDFVEFYVRAREAIDGVAMLVATDESACDEG